MDKPFDYNMTAPSASTISNKTTCYIAQLTFHQPIWKSAHTSTLRDVASAPGTRVKDSGGQERITRAGE